MQVIKDSLIFYPHIKMAIDMKKAAKIPGKFSAACKLTRRASVNNYPAEKNPGFEDFFLVPVDSYFSPHGLNP